MRPRHDAVRFVAFVLLLFSLVTASRLFAQIDDFGILPYSGVLAHALAYGDGAAPIEIATDARANADAEIGNEAAALATSTELLGGVTAISAGNHRSCALTSADGLKCWGNGSLVPTDMIGLQGGIKSISVGGAHSCVITYSGSVKCWGMNAQGQLGDGTTVHRMEPVDVVGLDTAITAVSASSRDTYPFGHTCLATIVGSVKCWGANNYGQLGNGTTTGETRPVDVLNLAGGVQSIATGQSHSCALTIAGGVQCWGSNDSGELGDGTRIGRLSPVEVIGLQSNVEQISAGEKHTCALMSSGNVRCWGANNYGQLGDGTTKTQFEPVDVAGLSADVHGITTGGWHSCAIVGVEGVHCWGKNRYGQIGLASMEHHSLVVPVSGLSNILAIAGGTEHTCALTTDGNVKCWGSNELGELGNGYYNFRRPPAGVTHLTDAATQVSIGANHTCIVSVQGAAKCWGSNFSGQLGDGSRASRIHPMEIDSQSERVLEVSANGGTDQGHACAVTASGGAVCWGENNSGALGDGTQIDRYTPVSVAGLGSGVVSVSTGTFYTCAVTEVGGVKCWGSSLNGQLGDGTTGDLYNHRLTPVSVVGLTTGAKSVATGLSHTCAVTVGGGVKCWGSNGDGKLGDGTNTNSPTPVDVSGLQSGAQQVVVGRFHSCALLNSGGVVCWGWNNRGELGTGTLQERSLVPIAVSGLSSRVRQISSGGSTHTCALTTEGAVLCWGDGYGNTPRAVQGLSSGIKSISSGGTINKVNNCAVTNAGGVRCWGYNRWGQLGVDPGWTPVDVIAGSPSTIPTPTPTPLPPDSAREPVIFIPGVAGSYLFEGPLELWPAMDLAPSIRNERHRWLSLEGQSATTASNVVATDVMRTIKILPSIPNDIYSPFLNFFKGVLQYKEYEVSGNVDRRTTAGCDMNQANPSPPTLFLFAYDWRKDISYNAQLLADYIGCVRRFHETGDIHIVAHSMGGLVARRYVLDNPVNPLGKVITMGTPWLGAVKFINVLESGDFVGGLKNKVVLNEDIIKRSLAFLPGAAQLLPSEEYWKANPQPLRIVHNTGSEIPLTYPAFVDLMNARYPVQNGCSGDINCRIGTWSRNFHNRLGQDRWLDHPSTIEYHYIYGVQSRRHTIESVTLTFGAVCLDAIANGTPIANCYTYDRRDLHYGWGDGTVPEASAVRDVGDGFPITRRKFPSTTPVGDEAVEHGQLPNNQSVQLYLAQLLFPAAEGAASVAVEPGNVSSIDSYYVRVLGVPEGEVSGAPDSQTSETHADSVRQPVGISYYPTGDSSFDVLLPVTGAYTLTFTLGSSPFNVEIDKGDGLNATSVYRYMDVVRPEGRTGALYFANGQSPMLKYDADGNGVPDTIIPPTHVTEDSAQLDSFAPIVTIGSVADGRYAVTAVDESGVRNVYYSFDGSTYFQYTSPLQPPATARVIYAFADDIFANRSAVITFQLDSNMLYLPTVQR